MVLYNGGIDSSRYAFCCILLEKEEENMAFNIYNMTTYGFTIILLLVIIIMISTAAKDKSLHSTDNSNYFHLSFQWNAYYFKNVITQSGNGSKVICGCNDYRDICQGGAEFVNLASNSVTYQANDVNAVLPRTLTGYKVKEKEPNISSSSTDSVYVPNNDSKAILFKKNLTGRESPNSRTVVMKGRDLIQDNPSRKQVHCHGQTQNFTLVSALFDLHREKWPKFRRRYDQYLNYSIPLLKMDVPLVAFIDSAAESFVRKHRQGKENVTHIVVTRLEELEYYEDYDTIKNIMDSDNFKLNHTILHHPEGFSPEYNILMNSKFSMLNHAANQNYFNSSHFYWIDMGYGHGSSDVFPKSCGWAPRNIMYNESISDKITYIQINNVELLSNIYQIYKTDLPPFLSGGFFGGSMFAVQHYYQVHRDMFKLFLRHKMIDDDQTLAILCYFKTQSLFHFVDGWWYDAFKLFN